MCVLQKFNLTIRMGHLEKGIQGPETLILESEPAQVPANLSSFSLKMEVIKLALEGCLLRSDNSYFIYDL